MQKDQVFASLRGDISSRPSNRQLYSPIAMKTGDEYPVSLYRQICHPGLQHHIWDLYKVLQLFIPWLILFLRFFYAHKYMIYHISYQLIRESPRKMDDNLIRVKIIFFWINYLVLIYILLTPHLGRLGPLEPSSWLLDQTPTKP